MSVQAPILESPPVTLLPGPLESHPAAPPESDLLAVLSQLPILGSPPVASSVLRSPQLAPPLPIPSLFVVGEKHSVTFPHQQLDLGLSLPASPTPQKTALESPPPVQSPSEYIVGREHCMAASVDPFASVPVKLQLRIRCKSKSRSCSLLTIHNRATLALAASKITLLPLPTSTTSTPPSLDYKVLVKDAGGTSTSWAVGGFI